MREAYEYIQKLFSDRLFDGNHKAHSAKEKALRAVSKQIPQKPDYYDGGDYAKCPNCGLDDFEYGINNWECNNCPNCGQALDWEKSEWNNHPLDYALECIVWYNSHYEWLEKLADELDKSEKSYPYPKDAFEVNTEEHFIWMLLVGMFGNWGTSINSGWIENTKDCANYIRALCTKATGGEA